MGRRLVSERMRYREARTRALFRALDADPDILLLGGMIALPYNPDDGLLERYADRVMWPPISEFAIAGMAIGAAMAGMRPLVAVGNAGFLFYGWAPVVNEAPNVRYLSGGLVSAPVVWHVMAGARRAGGAQHEHTPQAMLQSVAGLRIYAPGTPADVDAALHAALTGADPSVLIDHVLLAEHAGEIAPEPDPDPDRPELLRRGEDVLLIAYSLMTQRALEAADELDARGCRASVLNLRVIAPMPVRDVLEHAGRHERVVLVDEAHLPGSPASLLAARIAEELPRARPRIVCTHHAPSPAAPHLLDEISPTTQRIVEAAQALCGDRPGAI
jgi:pyruvate/2-oxoglutarate/acetoin dehydrogenase E1 component